MSKMEHTLFWKSTSWTWALYRTRTIPAKEGFKMNPWSTQAPLTMDKIGPPLKLLCPSYSEAEAIICEDNEFISSMLVDFKSKRSCSLVCPLDPVATRLKIRCYSIEDTKLELFATSFSKTWFAKDKQNSVFTRALWLSVCAGKFILLSIEIYSHFDLLYMVFIFCYII